MGAFVHNRFLAAILPLTLASILTLSCGSSQPSNANPQNLTDRERDGLVGGVKAVLTDDVILVEQNGQWIETQQAWSTSIYDESGKRTSQTPFRVALPAGFAITQHELFFDPAKKSGGEHAVDARDNEYTKYDEKGNVIEKGRRDTQAPQIAIKYEFDSAGNWIKRTISRLTEKNGQKTLLPAEASYRHIVYFNSASTANDDKTELVPAIAKQLKSPVAANEDNLARGRALFNQKCAACHGENGQSQTEFAAAAPARPEDLTGQKVRALTEGEIYSVINDGVKSSGMPAFKGRVSDESLWQIVLYVKRLSRNQAASNQTTLASSSPSPQPKASTVAEQRYPLKGKVVSVERELRQVMVEHEEIKGYMGAMTMPFPLKDEKILGKIKKDDRIEATLVVDSNGWRLENVMIK